jgi:hypothetical protein
MDGFKAVRLGGLQESDVFYAALEKIVFAPSKKTDPHPEELPDMRFDSLIPTFGESLTERLLNYL